MARNVSWGTPKRTDRFVQPRRAYPLVVTSLAVGGLVLAGLGLGEVVGFRDALSPGHVSSKHALYESQCQECHVPMHGASDVRCQRCHDPSSAGRMTNGAHVFFGSLDAAAAAAAPTVECALCHIEHRGPDAALAVVDEARCTGCHGDEQQFDAAFADFSGHTEFGVLARNERQTTGVRFSHLNHVTGTEAKRAYVTGDTCSRCHQLDSDGSDFVPLTFEAVCAGCHAGDLRMDPASARELVSVGDMGMAVGDERMREWRLNAFDFEEYEGEILKLEIDHKDPWVLHNLRKLRSELDPAGFAAERAALEARKSRLERRLALASPTALEGQASLRTREQTLMVELGYIEERLAAQATAAEPAEGLTRLDEVLAAAQATGEETARDEAEALVRAAAALQAQGIATAPIPRATFEQSRSDLLSLLDAIERADPERVSQVEELRRRLGQLSAGETSLDLLARARDQRNDTLRRVRDEVALRRSGAPPPSETMLAAQRQSISTALRSVTDDLALIDAVPGSRGMLSSRRIEAKQDALAALSKGCAICHEVSHVGAMTAVAAAEPVLWRARFAHRDHLTQGEECTSCHAGERDGTAWSIETSDLAPELNFNGVASCQECHRAGQIADSCQTCHNYHPPDRP